MNSDDIQTVTQPRQIGRMMDQLFSERGQLTLVVGDGALERAANVLEVNVERGFLVVDAFEGRDAEVIERAGEIHVKTVIAGIQTWFFIQGLERLHDRGDHYYHLPLPARLYRLQRRGAFRVRPSAGQSSQAHVQARDGSRTLRGPIHDISVTGVCFRFPREDMSLFSVGTIYENAYITCDCGLNFYVRLEVSNLREDGEKTILVGMRFLDLGVAAERAIDRAVQTMQREMIALA
ncbi:MAG: flagellar regulator YcgR PilZN domain-containing protein [Pseudomonadota bacterium]